jgi:O-antigen/teichoic acid export membrane protein
MINVKEHFRLTGLYTFFAAFPAVLQLVVYPIIEGNDRLGAEDFGYLAVAEALLSFLVMFALYGMSVTISRFYFDVKDDPSKYKRLVSTIFTGVIIRSILIIGIVILFADFFGTFFKASSLSDFSEYGHLLAIIACNRSIIMVALTLYRNEKRVRMFIVVSLVSGIARSIMQVVGVLYFDMSFVGYLTGTAIGGGVAAVTILVYTYLRCGFQYRRDVISTLSKYAFPLFLADIVFWGILFIDRFLLLNNPEALGIYDNAMKFAIGIQFVSQGLGGYIQPELYRHFSNGKERDEGAIKSLSNLFMAENIAVITALILPVMLFITWFYETSLTISAGLIGVVFVRYVFLAQFQIFLWPILYMKRSDIYLYVNLVVLGVVLTANVFLVPVYGYYGAIFAAMAGGAVQVIGFSIFQNRMMPIGWNRVKVLWFPFFVTGLFVAGEVIKLWFNLNMFAVTACLVTLVFFGLVLLYRHEAIRLFRKYF